VSGDVLTCEVPDPVEYGLLAIAVPGRVTVGTDDWRTSTRFVSTLTSPFISPLPSPFMSFTTSDGGVVSPSTLRTMEAYDDDGADEDGTLGFTRNPSVVTLVR